MPRAMLLSVVALLLVVPDAGLGADRSVWPGTYMVSSRSAELVSVFTLPGGGGMPLDDCRTYEGAPVDATIELTIMTEEWDPIVGWPAEDMWLQTASGGVSFCPDGNLADGPTDVYGETTFGRALAGGGASDHLGDERLLVYVNGSPLPEHPGFQIYINSADINGDLVVNLADVIVFTGHFFGSYDYAADLHWDGAIDLSDIVMLSQGMGSGCP
jgi:hypothetical protein